MQQVIGVSRLAIDAARPEQGAARRAAPAIITSATPLPRTEATLGGEVRLRGPGLHTGGRRAATVRPAPPGTGIVFHLPGPAGSPVVTLPALWRYRVAQPLCTALETPDGALVRTVEHLLAALSAARIDNAAIEVEGGEVPILDGSALPWCEALAQAGRVAQDAPRRYLRVRRPVEVVSEGRSLRIEPAPAGEDGFGLAVSLPLAHFGELAWEGTVDPASFRAELAPSRSFGRVKWALPAKLYAFASRKPLLRGATFRNTAALIGGRVIGGMRMPDEPARHRALDIVGDMALCGHPLIGRVTARRPGHDHNHALIARLMADSEAWSVETLEGEGA